jgi:hypothetical protein
MLGFLKKPLAETRSVRFNRAPLGSRNRPLSRSESVRGEVF